MSTSGRLTGRSYTVSVHISPDSLSSPESFRHRTISVSKGWRSLLVFLVHSKPKRPFILLTVPYPWKALSSYFEGYPSTLVMGISATCSLSWMLSSVPSDTLRSSFHPSTIDQITSV